MARTRIRPADVAPLLGMSAQAVRIQMQRGLLPIGTVHKSDSGTYTYNIIPSMLYKATGVKYNGYEPSIADGLDYHQLAKCIVEELLTKITNAE